MPQISDIPDSLFAVRRVGYKSSLPDNTITLNLICQGEMTLQSLLKRKSLWIEHFSWLQQKANGGCDRSEENANSAMAPDPTSIFRGLCLICSCFNIWNFDFKHCSLSPHVIISVTVKNCVEFYFKRYIGKFKHIFLRLSR